MKKERNKFTGIRILHEDPDVIVLEKDAGVLSQALRHSDAYSVEGAITDYLRKGQWKSSKRAFLVHRLDRETSGVMMIAKNEKAQQWLRDNWNDVTTKIYLAKVEGKMENGSGCFESYLREDENYFVKSVKNPQYGKYAKTEWKVADAEGAEHDDSSLVEVSLKSGRKNQIRVHFSEAGHPVVGDSKYGNAKKGGILCLHAWKLTFRHPHSGKQLSFEATHPQWAQ